MKQEIYDDPFDINDWDTEHSSRCFVHITNSLVWHAITGEAPPTVPPTAREYTDAGLPWFDYYDDSGSAVDGSPALSKLKSVKQMSMEKGDVVLPENDTVTPGNLVVYRKGLKRDQVREGVL